MKQFKQRSLSFVLCMVLIVAMALSMTACGGSANDTNTPDAGQTQTVTANITVQVVDMSGNEETFTYTTDQATVGEALLEVGLIAGDEGQYGLMVTEVNGITADYNVDQTYWAFYIDGAYASTGVDSTPVVDGATYTFKVEK